MVAVNKIRRPSETSKIYVHIGRCSADAVTGELFFPGTGKSAHFIGLDELLSVTETVLDELSYPQPTFQHRTFHERITRKRKERDCIVQEHEEDKEESELKKLGNDATFVIHVKYRQNATWQGEIKWVSRDKAQYFRSDLELVRLIEDALDEEFGEVPKIKWD